MFGGILTNDNQQESNHNQGDYDLHLWSKWPTLNTFLTVPPAPFAGTDQHKWKQMSDTEQASHINTHTQTDRLTAHLHVFPPHPPMQLLGSATEGRRIV